MKKILAVLLLVGSPLIGRADTLDIKTGAWEVTTSTAMAGMMMPKDELSQMPAAQRAKIEEMMRARAGKVNTHTYSACVTPQDLARGELTAKEKQKKNCTRKVISQTARHFEFEEVCAAPEPSKTHARFDATSRRELYRQHGYGAKRRQGARRYARPLDRPDLQERRRMSR